MLYLWTKCKANTEHVICIGTPILGDGVRNLCLYILQWNPVRIYGSSGIFMHSRGFGHVVKHATLSTWTKEEVSHALNTGNQVLSR